MSHVVREKSDALNKALKEKTSHPFQGKKLRLVRELAMDLNKLSDDSISILNSISDNMGNIEKYSFSIDNEDNFDCFPKYIDRVEDEMYEEGLYVVDFGIFSICIFIDIYNVKSKVCIGLFLINLIN